MKFRILFLFFSTIVCAQVGIGTNQVNSSAILQLKSNNKGFLPPVMTTNEKQNIQNPAIGLFVYDTDLNCISVNEGTKETPNWLCLNASNESAEEKVRNLTLTIESKEYTAEFDNNGEIRIEVPFGTDLSDGSRVEVTNFELFEGETASVSPGDNLTLNNGKAAITITKTGQTPKKYTINFAIKDAGAFVSVWKTTDPKPDLFGRRVEGPSKILLPLVNIGDYDFRIYWGDGAYGNVSHSEASGTDSYILYKGASHEYKKPGTYTIVINGKLVGWSMSASNPSTGVTELKPENLLEISQWGSLDLGHTSGQFRGASNMIITATDKPTFKGTTNFSYMFSGDEKLEIVPGINDWDVSGVTDMENMFNGASSFNQDISAWDVSGVTSMRTMFFGASSFNQDISSWNISNVKYMGGIFNNSALSTPNYNALLEGWSKKNVQKDVIFGAISTKYSPSYKQYRDILKSKGWIITDGGPTPAR